MKITCGSCGGESDEIAKTGNIKDTVDASGFDFVWDQTDELTPFWLCPMCSTKVQNHIEFLRGFFKEKLEYINFLPLITTQKNNCRK